jgi:hypothetical protein
VVLGLVAILDLTGAIPVWPSTYLAAALSAVALGLLVGSWVGRARWLIALGILTSIALGISTAAETVGGVRDADEVNLQPASLSAVPDRISRPVGDVQVDLRRVDFGTGEFPFTVDVGAGNIEIILPPRVDVSARVDVGAGDARILGESWSGFDIAAHEVADLGTDGAGGGQLRLLVRLDTGKVEVHR